jgi:hypothetical protein
VIFASLDQDRQTHKIQVKSGSETIPYLIVGFFFTLAGGGNEGSVPDTEGGWRAYSASPLLFASLAA